MYYSEIHKLWMPYEEKDDIAVGVVTEQVEFIDIVVPYINKRRTCIQAGGHIGIYPRKLSKHFSTVVTFEPNVDNFECLKKNIEGIPNIYAVNKGLSDKSINETFLVDSAPDGRKNTGSSFVKDREYPEYDLGTFTQDVVTIDSIFKDEPVDFIQLDVEGHEYEVLKGGEEVIKKWSPVIMVEGTIKNAAMVELLNKWGYYYILGNSFDGVFKK